MALRFRAADNLGLIEDVAATASGTAMGATVPLGTDVGHLVATFESTGTRVTVGGVAQDSGATPNDFSHPITYQVTAADGTSQDYTVTVVVAHEITSFGFHSVGTGITATIHRSERTISAIVPYFTDVTRLVATFEVSGATVTVGATPQVSGSTANNFTQPVVYTLTAADQPARNYTVTVTVAAPSTAKELTRFRFPANGNLDATIDQVARTVTVIVPFGTRLTDLVAAFETTGGSASVNGEVQVSGRSHNDFSHPVEYAVWPQDGTSQIYTVTVVIGPRPRTGKEITSFSFASVGDIDHGGVTATIDEAARTIVAIVPDDTDLGDLVATFETNGATVTVGGADQHSGTTHNDFTQPVAYEVTADDGTSQTYTVTVLAPSSAKEITNFGFPALPQYITGIAGTDIGVGVPAHTDVTHLVAVFETTGVTVTVGGVVQVSGTTPHDFTHALAYKVTAEDGTSQTYTVTVQVNQ